MPMDSIAGQAMATIAVTAIASAYNQRLKKMLTIEPKGLGSIILNV